MVLRINNKKNVEINNKFEQMYITHKYRDYMCRILFLTLSELVLGLGFL